MNSIRTTFPHRPTAFMLVALALGTAHCGSGSVQHHAATGDGARRVESPTVKEEIIDPSSPLAATLAARFSTAGIGRPTFVVRSLAEGGTVRIFGEAEARIGRTPASTFKIPNSLIALDTGVATDEHFALRWDGTRTEREVCNQDLELAQALSRSCVWYYQEIARRVGTARMTDYLGRFEYGNRDISSGIDQFWLGKSMRITPLEQVEFLTRLRRRTLGISTRSMELVERMLRLDAGDGWALEGKTGTMDEGPDLYMVWLVGIADAGPSASVFALRGTLPRSYDGDSRKLREALAKQLLVDLGALPPAASR
jgi:beta-lactamase class D